MCHRSFLLVICKVHPIERCIINRAPKLLIEVTIKDSTLAKYQILQSI